MGARLGGARLGGARLGGARLGGARLGGARLGGARLVAGGARPGELAPLGAGHRGGRMGRADEAQQRSAGTKRHAPTVSGFSKVKTAPPSSSQVTCNWPLPAART